MGDSSTVLFIVLIIVANLCCSNNWKGDDVMNIATKAALSALSGIKIASGYSLKGSGNIIGYTGKGIKYVGEKVEHGGFAMAKFGGEMVDSGFLAWKIASGALSEEQLQNIVNEAEAKAEAVEAEVVDNTEATGLANLKEAATKAAETAMQAVADVIKNAEAKAETVTATTAKTETKSAAEREMTPAEMAEAYC